jgi:hypothetical protein
MGAGQFQVFAETPDGTVAASIPVRYAVQGQAKEPPALHILYRNGREEVLGPYWGRTWCDVDALDRLELHFNPECPAPSASASGIAPKLFSFKTGPGPNGMVLAMDPELVRGWNEKGKLVITYRQCSRDGLPQELFAVPRRLDLPGAPFDFKSGGVVLSQRQRNTSIGARSGNRDQALRVKSHCRSEE